MTGKERAAFRAQANSLDVLFQIGKQGISAALIEQTEGALNTRELIKLRVLTETSPVTPRAAADEIAQKTGAEVIQVIGGVIVLYRRNPELHKKKAAPAKRITVYKRKEAPAKKSPFTDKKGRDKRLPSKTK